MRNTKFNRTPSTAHFQLDPLLLLAVGALACLFRLLSGSPDPARSRAATDAVVQVIGFDRSLSMDGHTPADTHDIRRICRQYMPYPADVIIVFDAIAGVSADRLLRLELEPDLPLSGLTLARHARAVRHNRAVRHRNNLRLEDFLRQCQVRIEAADRNRAFTDLNGFLWKVDRLLHEASFGDHRKLVYVQSDGRQDAVYRRNGKTVHDRTVRMPEWGDDYLVCVSEWEDATRPDVIDMQFESIIGFQQFLTTQNSIL